MGVLWACSGRALGVIWAGSGRALGVAGRALGMICSGVPLTFLWHVTNTAWQRSREASSTSKETRWTADAQKLYGKHRAPTKSKHQASTSLRGSSMLFLTLLAGISRGTPGGYRGDCPGGSPGARGGTLGGTPGSKPWNTPWEVLGESTGGSPQGYTEASLGDPWRPLINACSGGRAAGDEKYPENRNPNPPKRLFPL